MTTMEIRIEVSELGKPTGLRNFGYTRLVEANDDGKLTPTEFQFYLSDMVFFLDKVLKESK